MAGLLAEWDDTRGVIFLPTLFTKVNISSLHFWFLHERLCKSIGFVR
jgi:hypothetical protein